MSGIGKAVQNSLRDRAFVIVAAVLLIAAVGLQATVRYMQFHFRKERVALKKSLLDFNTAEVRPYEPRNKARMASEMEEALGTKEYLQMQFEDPTVAAQNGLGRAFNFFVTYYTGDPDQVPHVPEVCYLGGGFVPAGEYDTEMTIPGLGQPGDRIPVRELFFRNASQLIPTYQTVVYFFSVNGQYVAKRDTVRLHLADPRYQYAYFSKVELSFLSAEPPERVSALAVAERFFRKAVPVLVRDHWADWDALIKQGRQEKE